MQCLVGLRIRSFVSNLNSFKIFFSRFPNWEMRWEIACMSIENSLQHFYFFKMTFKMDYLKFSFVNFHFPKSMNHTVTCVKCLKNNNIITIYKTLKCVSQIEIFFTMHMECNADCWVSPFRYKKNTKTKTFNQANSFIVYAICTFQICTWFHLV